jgi:hypothetical protein
MGAIRELQLVEQLHPLGAVVGVSDVVVGLLTLALMVPGGVLIALGGIRFGRAVIADSLATDVMPGSDPKTREIARRRGLVLIGIGLAIILGAAAVSILALS